MNTEYGLADLAVYSFLYGFLGWMIRVACIALKERRYVNSGVLNLPVAVPFGLTAAVLLPALKPLDGHPVVQYLVTWAVMEIIYKLTAQFVKNVSRADVTGMELQQERPLAFRLIGRLSAALIHLVVYLVIHPFVFPFINWMPDWIVATAAVILSALTLLDFFSVRHALRSSRIADGAGAWSQRIGDRMTAQIWRRLERAYPGVERLAPEECSRYVFAKGICFDKLVWVFLVSSFLGALIEMVYCRVVGAGWMNRSSLLYGSFSVVWGFGAVVLTVVLQHLAGKEDRKIFLAGAVVGGAYEYLCSIFTELVFGTVFWDYSEMPLNIGGRTNLLYCIFWGLLAVVWLKILYPPMERGIEKIPPLPGKVITWAVVVVMLCNGLLTAGAMVRYTQRQTAPEPGNVIEALLDERYDDGLMEKRWPNMKIADDT